MTAAYRLKGLGWMGGVTMVALGFYLVSLQVASERKHLEGVNRQIASAQRDIRALETEFDTRANLAQLERWNGDTLALVAPTAGQFVRDEAQLASISFDGTPATGGAQVQTAQLIVPSLSGYDPSTAGMPITAPAASTPSITPAVLQVAKAKEEHAPTDRLAKAPAITRVAAIDKPAAAAMQKVAYQKGEARKPELRKAEAMAMLDKSLLSDSTLGDLLSGARSERRSR